MLMQWQKGVFMNGWMYLTYVSACGHKCVPMPTDCVPLCMHSLSSFLRARTWSGAQAGDRKLDGEFEG